MNTNLFTNDDGLRLIETFEGKPRLKARLCEGGRYELGYGVTFHLDGSPVLEGQTCTEDEAMAMFRNALQRFELAVMAHITVPLNSNQFSALVAFAYNVGEDNFKSSTVLRMVNQLRFEDAAAAFGMWVFATRDGYKQALRGLLRRRYAEACLFLSYDWVEACSDEAVALQRERPASLPGVDRVLYKTPFSNILRVAQKYPLGLTEPVQAKVPVPASIALDTEKVAVAPIPDSALPNLSATIDGIPVNLPLPTFEEELILDQPAVSASDASGAAPDAAPSLAPASSVIEKQNTGVSPPVSPAPVNQLPPSPPGPVSPIPGPAPPKPPPIIAPKSIDIKSIPYGEVDPSNGAKNMTDSTRFVGMLIVAGGSLVQVLAAREVVSSTAGAIFFDLSRDPVIVALIAGGVIWAVGSVTKMWGRKVITKGMVEAKEVLK